MQDSNVETDLSTQTPLSYPSDLGVLIRAFPAEK